MVVRTFAWIVVLGREGVINQALLMALGIISEPLRLLQTEAWPGDLADPDRDAADAAALISVMSRLDANLRDASAALGVPRAGAR